MGAYLSQPKTDKVSEDHTGHGIKVGVTEMQGWRMSMEDAHCVEMGLAEGMVLLGVLDGHGGPEVAKLVASRFPVVLRRQADFVSALDARAGPVDTVLKLLTSALRSAFLEMDAALLLPDSVAEMQELAGDLPDGAESSDSADELEQLARDAHVPIETLLAAYMRHADAGNDDSEGGSPRGGGTAGVVAGDDNSDATAAAAADDDDDTSSEGAAKNLRGHGRGSNGSGAGAKPPSLLAALMNEDTKDGDTTKTEGNGKDKRDEGSYGDNEDGEEVDTEDEDDDMGSSDDENDDDSDSGESSSGEDEEGDGTETETEDESLALESSRSGRRIPSKRIRRRKRRRVEAGAEEEGVGVSSGTTAVFALLVTTVDNKRYALVANAGDSRAVLCREGKAHDLSVDHKPEDDKEKARVEAAGGRVGSDGRVNGGLNLSRALGDHQYKRNTSLPPTEQLISCEPDVTVTELGPTDRFMVLACDGIWNSMESNEVVEFVLKRLDEDGRGDEMKYSAICEELCDACMSFSLRGDGTGLDNETAMIVML